MRRIRDLAVLVAATALAIGACSLPTDDDAALIDTDQLPDVLRSDLEVTTTTEQGPRAEPVDIYLLSPAGERTIAVPVGREIDPNASFEQEIGLLFRGAEVPDIRTEEDIENGLFNALTDFQLTEAFTDGSVAVIDMTRRVDEAGEPIDVGTEVLENAIAQLVYTSTGFPEVEPITAVRIRIDGQTQVLPTEEGDSRDLLRRSDFETYDADFVPPPTNAPPTTTVPDPADVDPGAAADDA
ncbi:MAG: GerMN domain-containing protein [Actinomycetota bacterium]